MKVNPIVFDNPDVAVVLTEEQAKQLGINPNENNPGELTVNGPWHIPVKFKALCITGEFSKDYFSHMTQLTIFGQRTLNDIQQSGYHLEGRVSIKGKKHSAFTTSKLFRINGKLIDCAVIFARIKPI